MRARQQCDANNEMMNLKFRKIHGNCFGRSVFRIVASDHVAVINFINSEFEVRPFLRPSRRLARTTWTALWQFYPFEAKIKIVRRETEKRKRPRKSSLVSRNFSSQRENIDHAQGLFIGVTEFYLVAFFQRFFVRILVSRWERSSD